MSQAGDQRPSCSARTKREEIAVNIAHLPRPVRRET